MVINAPYVSAQEETSCSCDPNNKTTEDNYDHVFSVHVNKVLDTGEEHIVNVDKLKSYKGYQNSSFDLVTPSNGCGVSFVRDTNYLVYARIDGTGRLFTDRCSHTTIAVETDQQVKQITRDRLARERGERVEDAQRTSSQTFPFLIFIIVSAGAVVFGLGYGRK